MLRSRHHHGDIQALSEEIARANMRFLLNHRPEQRDYSVFVDKIVTHDKRKQIYHDFKFIRKLEAI